MVDTRPIRSGTVRDFRWNLEAGGEDEQYWTGLEVSGPDGYRCSGGMGGPKLWGDDLINVYTARSDDGPVGIVVRAVPAVVRIVLRMRSGDESDLGLSGPDIIDGLRFFVGFVWPLPPSGEFGLDRLFGLDGDNREVASYAISFWDRRR